MKKLHGLLLILGLAVAFLCQGCASMRNADGTLDQQRLDALKVAFKQNVAAAVVLSAKDPKVRLYLTAAGPAICDLNKTHQFGPSQVEAALKGVTVKELQTPQVLLARAGLLNLYTLTFGFKPRDDLGTNTFAAGLVEVLCDGITDGLANQ